LSISDISAGRKWIKSGFGYLLLSICFLLFGAVYEMFSHEVYSLFMTYGFVVPLLGGALPFLWLGVYTMAEYPQPIAAELYKCGILTLTMGSIVQGILDIYGTTNIWVIFYWTVGSALSVVGLFLYLFHRVYLKRKRKELAELNCATGMVPDNQSLFCILLMLLILLFTSVSALKIIGIL